MNELDLEAVSVVSLAELLRPKMLDDIIGQEQLLGPQGRLRLMLAKGVLGSNYFLGSARHWRNYDCSPSC